MSERKEIVQGKGDGASGRSIVPFGLWRAIARLRRTLLLTWRGDKRRCLWTSVQSPLLYGFFIDVVRNRSAYYAYSEFAALWRKFSRRQRRLAKLLFRVANYVRPAVIFVPEGADERWIPFLCRGSKISSVIKYRNSDDLAAMTKEVAAKCHHLNGLSEETGLAPRPVMLILADCGDAGVIKTLSGAPLGRGSMVVATDIRSTPVIRSGWQQMCAASWASVSIDLYFAGLIMISPTFSQLHYKAVL